MTGMITALNTWLSQFGTFYNEGDIPDEAELPYGTVPIREPEWNQKTTFWIKYYERTTDSTSVLAKADQITAAIGTGVIIPYTGGYLVLWPETPLIQIIVDGDVRYAYINLSMNSYHTPGV